MNRYTDFNACIKSDDIGRNTNLTKNEIEDLIFNINTGINACTGEEEKVNYFDQPVDFLDLLVAGEFFKSKSQAKKCGWDRVIPPGFTVYKIAKRYMYVYLTPNDLENKGIEYINLSKNKF